MSEHHRLTFSHDENPRGASRGRPGRHEDRWAAEAANESIGLLVALHSSFIVNAVYPPAVLLYTKYILNTVHLKAVTNKQHVLDRTGTVLLGAVLTTKLLLDILHRGKEKRGRSRRSMVHRINRTWVRTSNPETSNHNVPKTSSYHSNSGK